MIYPNFTKSCYSGQESFRLYFAGGVSNYLQHWFDTNEKLCLKVPSAVVPENWNVVINTFHKDFKKVKLIDILDFEPDDRLEQIIKQNK